jgi:hypothetical protein
MKKKLFGVALAIGLIWVVNYSFNFAVERSELKEVSGVLSKGPIIHNGKKGHRCIKMEINEDVFEYKASGLSYEALNKTDLFRELKKGSLVTFLVSKENGSDAHLNLRDFYELRSKGKYYLILKDYNQGRKENRVYFLLIWCVLLVIYIRKYWWNNRRKALKNDAL